MENEFEQVMSQRTDEELIKIITVDKADYQPAAVEAAEKEIEKRQINIETITEKVKEEHAQEEIKKAQQVSPGIRFVNLLVDSAVIIFILLVVFNILDMYVFMADPDPYGQADPYIDFVSELIPFIVFFLYYIVMEISYQKTLGKFLTKTKVVSENDTRASYGEIIFRTVCRLIPFDWISFFFKEQGFHDNFSKTKVVKDIIINKDDKSEF